jgi:membrane associated rhomboid family serine protease
MFIPLRNENMRGRRWPYITFALMALNIVIFPLTHGPSIPPSWANMPSSRPVRALLPNLTANFLHSGWMHLILIGKRTSPWGFRARRKLASPCLGHTQIAQSANL